ncbi:MAG: JAB domain-containing protein [Thiobacillus sp.]
MSNEFDAAVAATMQPDQGQAARVGFSVAADTNPDAYAEAQRVARRTGVPVETVLNMPKEMKKQDTMGTIDFDALAKTAPATASLLSDIERAKVAHDNLPSMTAIERSFLGNITEPVQRGLAQGRGGLTLLFDQMGIFKGLERQRAAAAAAHGISYDPSIELAVRLAQQQREVERYPVPDDIAQGMQDISNAQTMGDAFTAIRTNPRAVLETTLQSLGASTPAIVGAAGGSVFGPGGTATGAGLGSFAVEYSNTLQNVMAEKGVNGTDSMSIHAALNNPELMAAAREKALKRGIPVAIFDALTAGLAGKLLAGAKPTVGSVGARAAGELGLQAGGGAAGEAGAQLATGEYKPGDILMEAFAEMPTAIIEVPGNYRHAMESAQRAQKGAEFIDNLNKLVQADKLVARDPQTFEQFVAQAAEAGPVQQVFIDAQTLMQSGVAQQVAAVSPAVASQLATAAQTGGQIAIPVEEYAARIAPTEYAQGLLDHLKTEPEGFSRAEAQQFMQSHAEELQAEVERTLAEKQVDDTFKASAEVVRNEIRSQLDTAARFTPQVNDAYSAMVGNFYATMAAKMGTTPEELFQRYPLKIAAERIDGPQFDQGQAPAGAQPGEVYNQSRKGKRDDYTLDLFGVPDNTRADTPAGRPAAGRQERPLSRDDAPGTYAARTELVEENTRELGTDRVTTPQEAAQALAYLAKGAVERFDALVTDADGKPLAIVGAFKGALTQASVFPSTLAAEAFRVNGAANIWFAHNHPSGTNELSNADRQLHSNLAEVFRGSEIKARGIFAIAGKEGTGRNWVFEPTPESRYNPEPDVRGVTTAPGATASVPVVERVYTQEDRLGPAITSPTVAKSLAKNLSGGESGVVLMTAQNEPVAFVPVDPAEAGVLRRGGRMDALYRALSVSNAGAAIIVNNGTLGDQTVQNLAGLFNSLDARVLDVMDTSGDTVQSWAEQGKQFNDRTFNQEARGAFNPASLTITMLKGADLSTFLHESGHFFLEVQADLAGKLQQEAEIFGMDTLKPGERQILADTDALLRWFGVRDLAEWHNLDFEQKRSYHEQFARGFEAYLFEGKAPSIELQGLFQRFRAWLLSVYRELKALNVELTDEVRGVFDRLLATNEQITLAEQGRSMMPLFTSPEQAGMTPEEFAAYQALGVDATAQAIEDLQARGLRDMRWLHNARGRIIKQLQKDAEAQRAQVRMDVRREVMSQPIYRAWQFLTGKLTADDKIAPPAKRTSSPDSIDETQDSLFAAIAKLGGLNRAAVQSEWGIDPKERIPMPAFGKHVLRREGGLSIDAMGEALGQYGYLTLDEHGKHDLHQLKDKFFEELRGNTQYSIAYDYAADMETRAGDQVVNPQALGAGRFDMGELRAMGLPTEVINAVQARRMTAGNGLHPDIVAEMFGFTSGDELVRKLAQVETPSAEIEALTDVRMLEQFGDLSSPEAIEKAADKAIHNDARARFVATEANALAKATGQRKVLASAAKEFARAMIARLKVRDIKPGQYANAEVRAAKAAEKASKSGDLATAAAEKRNQLIQNYATRAAYDAQENVDRGLRYLKKFEGDIKGLDADYADQIGNLLERFDLRKGQSNKAVDKRTALAEWIKAQREAGLEPDIPPELENEAFRTSYKNLTVEEFQGLVDTVRQIEHLGRLKHKLLTAADQRAYEAVRDEIAGSIRENAQGRQADTRTPTTNMGRALQGLKRFWASHIKAATWARVMDGGKDGGPMWEYFVRSANERGDQETTMRAEATAKLSEILAPVFKLGRMGGKGQFFPSINRSLNREARLAIALNTGNTGNLQRLLGGEGWTMAQLTPVLQSLTAQEWAAVQAVWDHFESYRPQIAEKERRVYGKEPEWVAPQPFAVTTADGSTVTLRGGYYPIKYDPAASQRAEEHADAESAKRQLQGAYTTATTRRSFTKARVEEVSGRPLLYTLAGMYSGVNDVIHDLAWHEWLIDANRLLRSHAIDTAIREHYGPEAKQQFKTWVQDVAEGDKGAANAGEAALGRLRQGVSASGLGFNVMSAAIQIAGFNQSIVRVGAPWIGRGIAKYLGNPLGLTRTVHEMSDFMANRARTRFRELNELRNQVQDQSAFNEFIGRYAYFMMMRVQQVVDVPTWWGAYEKAIAAGNEETRAVALADQAVIDAQGSGQTKDLSAIERGGPALRLFTVFYSFMNTALNLGVAQTMGANTPAKRAKLAVDYLMLYTVPAVLGYTLKAAITPGDSGDDDLEEIAKKLAAEQLGYLMGLMVVVREFNEVAKMVTGNPSFGYSGPAGLRGITDAQKFGQQAMQGEFDDAFRKSAVNLIGDFTGLPAAQINRTLTGTQALAEGKTENPAAVAFGFQEPR